MWNRTAWPEELNLSCFYFKLLYLDSGQIQEVEMPRIILFSQYLWIVFKQGSWKNWNQSHFHLPLYLTNQSLCVLHKLLMPMQQVLI